MSPKFPKFTYISLPNFLNLFLPIFFDQSKLAALKQLDHALAKIKLFLLEKKSNCRSSNNPADEKILSLGIRALRLFAESLAATLKELEDN